jgi:hypothetical protein
MLNPVASAPPAPRRLRAKTLSEDAVDATDMAKTAGDRARPDQIDPDAGREHAAEDPRNVASEEKNRTSAIDEAMKSLLQDAADFREPSAAAAPTTQDHPGRVKDVRMIPDFRERRAVERHITAATLYERLERSDNRDAVLRPGAVFSKTY